jgi:hypothetical protein
MEDALQAIDQPRGQLSLKGRKCFEAVVQDLMSTLVLICAALASLGLGVILAFAVCRAGFALLRLQSPRPESSAAPAKTQTIEA